MPTAVTKLADPIRREKIDLLHLHNSPGMFWGTLAQIASATGVPIVRTEHNPYSPEGLPTLYRWLYPRLTKRASKVICVSERVRRSFAEAIPRAYRQGSWRFRTASACRITKSSRRGPNAGHSSSCFPGPSLFPRSAAWYRLENYKLPHIQALFRVRQTVNDVHLAIIGEGDMRESLAACAADLGVSEYVSL